MLHFGNITISLLSQNFCVKLIKSPCTCSATCHSLVASCFSPWSKPLHEISQVTLHSFCHTSQSGSFKLFLLWSEPVCEISKFLCIHFAMHLSLAASQLYSLHGIFFTWSEHLIQFAYISTFLSLALFVFAYLLTSLYLPRVLLWQPHANSWKLPSGVHDLTLFMSFPLLGQSAWNILLTSLPFTFQFPLQLPFSWRHIDQHMSPFDSCILSFISIKRGPKCFSLQVQISTMCLSSSLLFT